MSVAGKHFYRFEYLKSDHWRNLRLEKLAKSYARCFYCLRRDLSNDVHHLNYRNLYNVELDDLVVLCRTCHDKWHRVLDEHKDEVFALEHSKQRAMKMVGLVSESEGGPAKGGHYFKQREKELTANKPKSKYKTQVPDKQLKKKFPTKFLEQPLNCFYCIVRPRFTEICVRRKRDGRESWRWVCKECHSVFAKTRNSDKSHAMFVEARKFRQQHERDLVDRLEKLEVRSLYRSDIFRPLFI